MDQSCLECPRRDGDKCDRLCPDAEQYVSQDEIPQRELNIGFPEFGSEWPIILKSNEPIELAKEVTKKLTPIERVILSSLLLRSEKNEICQLLGITAESYDVHFHNLKKKVQKMGFFLRSLPRVGEQILPSKPKPEVGEVRNAKQDAFLNKIEIKMQVMPLPFKTEIKFYVSDPKYKEAAYRLWNEFIEPHFNYHFEKFKKDLKASYHLLNLFVEAYEEGFDPYKLLQEAIEEAEARDKEVETESSK